MNIMFKCKKSNLRVNHIRVSLKEIIHEIIEELHSEVKVNNIELKVEVEDKYALGVKSEIKAIIFNLLDNAIKYSKGKRVHLILYEDNGKVKFEIFNKCRKLPKTILDTIFKPFLKLGQKNREVGSIGLGLFLCRQLAELNEGSIDFNYGKKNLRFILTLKVAT